MYEGVKKRASIIMASFEESGKKHLLITGSKQSGKTTVLKEILKNKKQIGGIITRAIRDQQIPPKYVILSDLNEPDKTEIIARRNDSSTGLILICKTFETIGVNILKKCIESDIETIIIDEIGFLESDAPIYQKAIMECLEQKQVIFVLRKQETELIEGIKNRDDVYLVDIDDKEF